MSKKIRLDRKIGFQNTIYTKCINVIIDSIGPSIILRSILGKIAHQKDNGRHLIRLNGMGQPGKYKPLIKRGYYRI